MPTPKFPQPLDKDQKRKRTQVLLDLGAWQRKLQMLDSVVMRCPVPSDLQTELVMTFEAIMHYKLMLQLTAHHGLIQSADLDMQVGDAQKTIQQATELHSKLAQRLRSVRNF